MLNEKMLTLNQIYEPLRLHAHRTVEALKTEAFECTWGFFAQHSVRNGKDWFFEHYPIPVITVINSCEIGFDLNHTFIEYTLSRADALAFDFSQFSGYIFEVYGMEDYLSDFYRPGMKVSEIAPEIERSNEQAIGVSIFMNYLESVDTLIGIVHRFKEIKVFRNGG